MCRVALLTSRAFYQNPIERFFQHAALSLGPFYLEAYLRRHLPQVEVFLIDRLEDVFELKPDLVGLSSASQNYTAALNQARIIKEKLDIPVVVGGSHITALPETLGQFMDVGVIGEGEATFAELLTCFMQGQWNTKSFQRIEGIVYWHENKPKKNSPRKTFVPIEDIPKPRRVAWAEKIGVAHLVTSRGCPFTCSFCTESATFSKYRVFSIDTVVDEIKDLVLNYDVKYVRFYDDVFNINLKRVQDLAARLKAEGLTQEVAFGAWGRASTMNEKMLDAMQEMNMKFLAFGFESGSDATLAKLKTGTKVEHNLNALNLSHDRGLLVAATFIIGYPGETQRDIEKTYDFVAKNMNRLSDIEINPVIPLPGTALWYWALKNGHVSNQMQDWGVLKDQALIKDFDPNKYIYLNEKEMSYASFHNYVKQFWQLIKKQMHNPLAKQAAEIVYADPHAVKLRPLPINPGQKVA